MQDDAAARSRYGGAVTHLLPRSTPEQQSVPASAIAQLIAELDRLEHVHTLTVVRHGHVVAEATWHPYERDLPTAVYSVSKSFTAIAVGLAIEEDLLGLDDRVIDLLPGRAPTSPGGHLAALRVRDLLTMTTGHLDEPPLTGDDWVGDFLAHDMPRSPGSHWLYNTPATHVLSAIVHERSGENLLRYLRPRLFDPLGFRDPVWAQSPVGIDAGGFGLSVRPEELAVFGQLLLQRGRWAGRQLVPGAWIDQATAFQVANDGADSETGGDWTQGYGFQFWRCRHGAYRADGAFGQYVVVLPEHDAVVAITGGLSDMQKPLDAVWQTLLPAFGTADDAAVAPAVATPVPAPSGTARGIPVEYAYHGPIRRLRVTEDTIEIDGVALACVPGRWSRGTLAPDASSEAWYGDAVAVAGGWSDGGHFTAELRLLGDASTYRLSVRASGRLEITRDVGFGPADVWAGDPVGQAKTSAHHSVVSP